MGSDKAKLKLEMQIGIYDEQIRYYRDRAFKDREESRNLRVKIKALKRSLKRYDR